MSAPQLVALVVRPKVRIDDSAEVQRRAFWRLVERAHVHDYGETTMPTVYACRVCGTTLRRIK